MKDVFKDLAENPDVSDPAVSYLIDKFTEFYKEYQRDCDHEIARRCSKCGAVFEIDVSGDDPPYFYATTKSGDYAFSGWGWENCSKNSIAKR